MTLQTVSRTADQAATAVIQLLRRLLPQAADAFHVAVNPQIRPDTFELSGGGSERVTVRGDTPLSAAAGVGWYLKHHCHVHFSWSGDQRALPAPLPRLRQPVRITSAYRWRYYLNYCTFSYSMAFWDWKRWEREIDWMALSGINLPLAIVGQEAVWQRVYREMGLSDAELGEFFAGPAFLAWGWMGNLDGWGGPSPQSWIDGQSALQRRILTRMRELGIKPVLPAFTGHVPPALIRHFDGLKVRRMDNWAENFPGTYVLDPTDPMFHEIGRRFIETQMEVYGTDASGPHFYSCDTFNENSPPDDDPAYLATVGRKLYDAMAAADPHATWVLQDWMFHFNPTNPGFWKKPQIHAFLDAIPDEGLLVLDLHSDSFPLGPQTDALCGKPWVWCYLHSFGGRQAMFGNIDRLAADPPAALADRKAGRLVGFGLTPEGIEQNAVLYDLATDMMWRRQAPDVDRWLARYLRRRYGASSAAAARAWEVLRRTVYSRPPECGSTVSTPVNFAPSLHGYSTTLSYPPHRLIEAWEKLVAAAEELRDSDPFQFDLVDVARQVLCNFAATLQQQAAAAFEEQDVAAFRAVGRQFDALILDLDRLLATRGEFLLGRWLESAKAWGGNDAERQLMEQNARRQITLWGNEPSMLRDYGRKDWAGMMASFYRIRWQRFFEAAGNCLARGEPFDAAAFQRKLRQWEEQWVHRRDLFPTDPRGDSISVASTLLEKYRPQFAEAFARHASLSTGKPTTASHSQPGQGPELAVVGIPQRCAAWSSRQGSQIWQVDLGADLAINAVHLFTFWDGQRAYRYQLQLSADGSEWTTVADLSDNTTPATPRGTIHRFDETRMRYVRLAMNGNTVNAHNHLLDVRVYGPACPLPSDR